MNLQFDNPNPTAHGSAVPLHIGSMSYEYPGFVVLRMKDDCDFDLVTVGDCGLQAVPTEEAWGVESRAGSGSYELFPALGWEPVSWCSEHDGGGTYVDVIGFRNGFVATVQPTQAALWESYEDWEARRLDRPVSVLNLVLDEDEL